MSSPGRWAALLAREVDAGLAAARLHDLGGTLRVVGVTARVGAAAGAAGFADAREPDPWQVELRWEPIGADDTAREPRAPPLPPVVARLPISALRGVDRVWRRRLVAAGWKTVAAVAEADLASVASFAKGSGSRLPLVVWSRARSCAVALPEASLRSSEGRVLGDLWTLPPVPLAETLGWSADRAQALSRALLRLAAVLDLEALDRLSLTDLLRR